MENQKTDEEVLQDFLLDIECLDELNQWANKFNIFDVLKISRTEIRHSNMLAWLLDASENHGMGDAFVKGVMQRVVENDEESRYDIFELLLLDFSSFTVYREWKNIDLLLVSEKEQLVIAIENKVGSHEHDDQLNRYRHILENEYVNFRRICIYLTPDGEEPSDVENWSILTYRDVVEVLENIKDRENFSTGVELMICNYIDILRRDVVEDERLVEICNKIYRKHRRALDLIFENRTDEYSQLSEKIKSILKEESVKRNLYFENFSRRDWIPFHTEFMNRLLPPMEETVSSWNTKYTYSYWFRMDEDRFEVIFEVGGINVPDLQMKNIFKLIDILKPEDKKKTNFKYKRLYRTKWYHCGEEDDDLREKVKMALNEVELFESRLADKI